MQSSDSIRVLLQVRCQREELEERRLTAIIEKMKLAQSELADVSAELKAITTSRLSEIQSISASVHHQAVEAHSRLLWRRCADQAEEIEKLKELRARQMSAYLSAHREREVMESIHKQRMDALAAERQRREQKLSEDLFLARRVVNWDT
jgi:flagellar export protein FliJ